MMHIGSLGRVVNEESKAEFRKRLKDLHNTNRAFGKKLPFNKDLSFYDEKGITPKGNAVLGGLIGGIGSGMVMGPVGAALGGLTGATGGYMGGRFGRNMADQINTQYEKGLR